MNGRCLGLLVALLSLSACENCDDERPPETETPIGATCVVDDDCPSGQVCGDGNQCKTTSTSIPIDEDDAGAVVDAGPPPEGALSILPESIVEFGAERLGQPVERNLVLRNTGDANLTILQIVIDDDPRHAFVAQPAGTVGIELEPGADLGVSITHTPNDGLADEAELKVLHTGHGALASATLTAEFKGASSLSASLDVTTLAPDVIEVDFGDVPLGTATVRKLYLRNDGAFDSALGIAGLVVTPASTGFTLQAPRAPLPTYLSSFRGACAGPGDCPPSGPTCTEGLCYDDGGVALDAMPLTLTFTPQGTGDAIATLTLTHDEAGALGTLTDIRLKGRGISGSLVASPAAVRFPDAFVGRPSRTTLHLANEGRAALSITGFEVSGTEPPFAVEHGLPLPRALAPGESVDVTVAFTATAPGGYDRTLVVNTEGARPTSVPLSAQAREAPHVVVVDDALDTVDAVRFGEVYVSTVQRRTIAVANTGPGLLRVTRMRIEGPQAERFSVSPTDLPDLLVASSAALDDPNRYLPRATLTLSYLPTTLNGIDDRATLLLDTDDPDRRTVEVPLVGRAVQPILVVTPTTVDFGPLLVGLTATRTVELRNTGVGNLVVTALDVPAGPFTVTTSSPLPATVQPFSTPLSATITFAPTTASPSSASMVVHSTDGARAEVRVTLGGGGSSCTARANASVVVDAGTRACAYRCNTGFHACGDACLANTSADSCGDRCTPCAARANASRGCDATRSECTYTCSAQFYDLNSDVRAGQNVSSDGCEYQCDVGARTSEVCNGLDDDCDGTKDEGLPLENSEPPAQCSPSATDLGNVGDNNIPVTFSGFKIYPRGDQDWLRFRGTEFESNFCVFGESYRTTIELIDVPAGEDYDLEVRDGSCSGTVAQSAAGSNANESVSFEWSGSCGSDDVREFFVHVSPFTSGSCFEYKIRVTHDRR
jgi:hypothetical protein